MSICSTPIEGHDIGIILAANIRRAKQTMAAKHSPQLAEEFASVLYEFGQFIVESSGSIIGSLFGNKISKVERGALKTLASILEIKPH
jgi:hypothetical protein